MNKTEELITLLEGYNKWRKGHESATMPLPTQLSIAIDDAIALIKSQEAEIERLESEVSDLKHKVSLGKHGFKMGDI